METPVRLLSHMQTHPVVESVRSVDVLCVWIRVEALVNPPCICDTIPTAAKYTRKRPICEPTCDGTLVTSPTSAHGQAAPGNLQDLTNSTDTSGYIQERGNIGAISVAKASPDLII